MSTQQPPWQYVALAVVGSSFFLGVFALVPDDQPDMRTALLGLLTLAGQAAVARWIVGHVHHVSRETKRDVSRETSRTGRHHEDHQ